MSPFLGKAYALGNLDRDEEALLVCGQALALDSNDPLLYLYKGNALTALERHGNGLEAFEQALRPDSDCVWAHKNKSRALAYFNKFYTLFALKRYDEATRAQQAIRLDPSLAPQYTKKGKGLQVIGKSIQLLRTITKAVHKTCSPFCQYPAKMPL